MAKCNYCNSTILFGGIKDQNYRFCNKTCYAKGQALIISNQIPKDVVMEHVNRVFNSDCPQCKKSRGPVDVHTSHNVYSFLVLTSWKSTPRISCRSCGVKKQSFSLVSSILLGWWGFPWGILITPVQIVKNISGMVTGSNIKAPSENLRQAIKLNIANAMLEQQIMENKNE